MRHRPLSILRTCFAVPMALLLGSTYGCDVSQSPEPLIQTLHPAYEIEADAEGNLLAYVDYVFTNQTGGTVYLVNCRGSFGTALERWDGREWTLAWGALTPDCLSPPITIEPGETFEDTLTVISGCPGRESIPALDCEDPEGTYRILWTEALSSFQSGGLPFGPDISPEYRVSNAFDLVKR